MTGTDGLVPRGAIYGASARAGTDGQRGECSVHCLITLVIVNRCVASAGVDGQRGECSVHWLVFLGFWWM